MELIIEAWTAGEIDYETMMNDLYDYKLRQDDNKGYNKIPLHCADEEENTFF